MISGGHRQQPLYCEISDQSTCRGSLTICDQCECAYHEECLEGLTPNAGDAFICPKCRDILDEVMHRRLNKQLPPPKRHHHHFVGTILYPSSDAGPESAPGKPHTRSLSDGGAYIPTQWGLRGYSERSDRICESMVRFANLHVGRNLDLD